MTKAPYTLELLRKTISEMCAFDVQKIVNVSTVHSLILLKVGWNTELALSNLIFWLPTVYKTQNI